MMYREKQKAVIANNEQIQSILKALKPYAEELVNQENGMTAFPIMIDVMIDGSAHRTYLFVKDAEAEEKSNPALNPILYIKATHQAAGYNSRTKAFLELVLNLFNLKPY